MFVRLAKSRYFLSATLAVFVLTGGVGCVSQKPLPYSYKSPQPVPVSGPKLIIDEVNDQRSKDNMDKALKLPASVEEVVLKEMEGAGIFHEVVRKSNSDPEVYILKPTLTELRWEVPSYDRKVGTAMGLSIATGGIGGLIYGSTGTEVLGHSSMRFILLRGEKQVLNKEYKATATEKKSKLSCDTPDTYREMAAKALQQIMQEFKEDLQKIDWKDDRRAGTKTD
jgi:hypothetical protein